MDAWVSPIVVRTEAKYFFLIINGLKCYKWIFFLNAQSDANLFFQSLLDMVEGHLNVKMKSIQTDKSQEFSFVTTHLSKLVVVHRKT